MKALRVGVPQALLGIAPHGGHGKVWRRVLDQLDREVELVPVGQGSRRARFRLRRGPHVVLASGHSDVPAARAPLVVQVHEAGWFDEELRATLDASFLAEIETLTRAALAAASEVIVPSRAVRRDIAASYSLDSAHVHAVPHGVDDVFRPDAEGGRSLVARARGVAAPYILFAAALHPRKNLEVVRRAVADLAGEGFPHALVIAGNPALDRQDPGPLERAAAAELPGAPGRVVRLPGLDDAELAGLMAGAEVFCLPSLYEGFGLTAVEAMACATPVVVSDRGSLPEVVADAGVVVPPSLEAVRTALRRLLVDPAYARELGRAGAARAAEFTWARTGARWLEVLRRAAGPAYTAAP